MQSSLLVYDTLTVTFPASLTYGAMKGHFSLEEGTRDTRVDGRRRQPGVKRSERGGLMMKLRQQQRKKRGGGDVRMNYGRPRCLVQSNALRRIALHVRWPETSPKTFPDLLFFIF